MLKVVWHNHTYFYPVRSEVRIMVVCCPDPYILTPAYVQKDESSPDHVTELAASSLPGGSSLVCLRVEDVPRAFQTWHEPSLLPVVELKLWLRYGGATTIDLGLCNS